jgi:hypothetical protein
MKLRITFLMAVGALALVLAALHQFAQASPQANTYIVNGTSDPAPSACTLTFGGYNCLSLRSAIIAANDNFGPDVIRLTHGVTYTLTIAPVGADDDSTGDLNITSDVTFNFGNTICLGGNCGATIQAGAGWTDHILNIANSAVHVNMSLITIRGGHKTGGVSNGGGIVNSGFLTLTNCLIRDNYTAGSGGGIFNYVGGQLILIDTQVISNIAVSGGGGGIFSGGGLALTSSSLLSNVVSSGEGGGLNNTGGAVLSNTLVLSNTAPKGGGLYNFAVLTATGSLISGNRVNAIGGGGIYNEYGRLYLIDTKVQSNQSPVAASYGGGLYNTGRATLDNSRLLNNTVNGAGGGAYTIHPGTLTLINGSAVNSNKALAGNGGGIEYAGDTLTLNNSSVMSNTASLDGGGLSLESNYTATIVASKIISNSARNGGGVINQGTFILISSTLARNTAKNGAGLENLSCDSALLTDNNILTNTIANNASGDGGGIWSNCPLTVNNNLIRGNAAQRDGGGIFNYDTLMLNGGSLISNTAQDGGGLANWDPATMTLTAVSLISNTAPDGGGGGVFLNGGTMYIAESAFYGNQAVGGGALNVSNGILTLVNSTLSRNSAAIGGGLDNYATANLNNVTVAYNTGYGLYAIAGSLRVANTLIAGNSFSDCNGTLNSRGYNLIQNTTNCTITGVTQGNITNTNPLLGPLQNNGGATWTRALLGGSPAINTANPATPLDGLLYRCLPIDQRGQPRPADGRCDIGAYEYGAAFKVFLPLVLKNH